VSQKASKPHSWGLTSGYRTNFFSALCGALASSIFGLCFPWHCRWNWPAATALIFMFGNAQMVNAQASEVFAWQFCLRRVLWAAWRTSGCWRPSAGLGLGNHQTLVLITPALAVLFVFCETVRRARAHPSLMISLAAGFSINGFSGLRAAQVPVIKRGKPQHTERLWRVLTRADYGSNDAALGETPERSIASTLQQLERFAHDSARNQRVGMDRLAERVWGLWKHDLRVAS